ncbi:MAG: cytochrome c3 family protein [Deinococcales bacterium]
MPQYFPPNSNAFAKWSIFGGVIFLTLLLTAAAIYVRSYRNQIGVPVAQPVPFSHKLHAGELGLDCRYCHSSVEVAATANIPPTETCMTCHSQIRVGSPRLEPIQVSWDTQTPIAWNRVHDLADFVYFNHSAHINKGIGCSSCHGELHRMEGIWKNQALSMGWCLECHRAPEKFVRPIGEVFNTAYPRRQADLALGRQLVEEYHINTDKLPQCSTCHR